MPKIIERNYKLYGPARVKIYSQGEMATVLGITETRLIGALGEGIGLSYHAHPYATGSGYEFNESAYRDNIKVWRCFRDGGHSYRHDPRYDYLPAGARTCKICGDKIFGGSG